MIYFFLFFLLVQSVSNSIAELSPQSEQIIVSDAGFQKAIINPYSLPERCDGKSEAAVFFGFVPCKNMLDADIDIVCDSYSGCNWVNETSLFNITIRDSHCAGTINKTFYNLSGVSRKVCDELHDETNCTTFKCLWLNQSTVTQEAIDSQSEVRLTSIWDTVKFTATFQIDLHLGTFNFIFIFLFFYIPLFMLAWAMYMALPWVH